MSAISMPARTSPMAPSIVSRSVSRIRSRRPWMTRSVIAAAARTSRIGPCWVDHRSVTATIVAAAKMNTHVATRMTRYRAAGRRSPGAVGSRSGSSSRPGRPFVPSPVGVRHAIRRSRSPMGVGETTISARNARSAIPSSASSVSIGTSCPRVRRRPRAALRSSYRCRSNTPLGNMPDPVRGAPRVPAGRGSARPPLVALLHQAQVHERLGLAHAGILRSRSDRNWSSASLSSATASTRMS